MEIKKHPKADISSWSSIFFLTGLVIMLSTSLWLIEFKSYDTGTNASEVLNVGDILENDIPITELLTPPPPPPPPSVVITAIDVIEDDSDIEEIVIESTETNQNVEIVDIQQIEEEEEEEEIVDIPFTVIEDVPIYPGCEGLANNDAKKQCMADKVMKFVQKNFNDNLASELGLEGQQRISVTFKIDHTGCIVNVRARAPHPRLEEEAIRVINTLPNMTPGMQRGKAVGVLYSLPILFKVELKK